MDFTLAFCATTSLLSNFNGETSCILYFFGLGKYMKMSLWNHLSALFLLAKHEKVAELFLLTR